MAWENVTGILCARAGTQVWLIREIYGSSNLSQYHTRLLPTTAAVVVEANHLVIETPDNLNR
jgi:hypothetical protein